MKNKTSHRVKGFTLIELLVVIAVLGILAAAVLVSVNPIEQLARGRDSGRKSAVTQIGRALQSYYTTQTAYPPCSRSGGGLCSAAANTWMNPMLASGTGTGDIKVAPKNPNPQGYVGGCGLSTNALPDNDPESQNGYCYHLGTPAASTNVEALVYARAESTSEKSSASCTAVGFNTWIVWGSIAGRTGLICKPVAQTNLDAATITATDFK